MFLTAPDLSAIPGITHGFFTRNGGVSKGLYASLNCGRGSSDNPLHVQENLTRVAKTLRAEAGHLLTLHQIHSADVITAKNIWDLEKRPQADAMATNQPGIALGVLAADCTPVLFADAHAKVIGAAHSGWKGAISGVIENTLKAMGALGAEPSHITAAVGPCIGKASYEVSDTFRQTFLSKDADSNRYFIPAMRAEHWLFDLKAFIHAILIHSGVGTVNILENDTYLEESNFFSYRRATHRNEPDYGRQISAIMLRNE